MFDAVVSRWTVLHFAIALSCFVLAQTVMASGLRIPGVSLFAPTTLIAVHLLTIGWLTLLMLGVLHQFVPVITARGNPAGNSALVSVLAIVHGLAAIEAGFLALNGRLPPSGVVSLPFGGNRGAGRGRDHSRLAGVHPVADPAAAVSCASWLPALDFYLPRWVSGSSWASGTRRRGLPPGWASSATG